MYIRHYDASAIRTPLVMHGNTHSVGERRDGEQTDSDASVHLELLDSDGRPVLVDVEVDTYGVGGYEATWRTVHTDFCPRGCRHRNL